MMDKYMCNKNTIKEIKKKNWKFEYNGFNCIPFPVIIKLLYC